MKQVDEKELLMKFQNRKGKIIGNYRTYGVMILLYKDQGNLYIILEKRALTLRSQPGDICLPGGKIELNETPLEGAEREAVEELRVHKNHINYLGEMDYLVTPYGAILYPYIGTIDVFPKEPNKEEVHEIIKLPLEFLMKEDPKEYIMDIGPRNYDDFPFHLIEGGKNYKFSHGPLSQYFYEFNGHIIWGFTARILYEFSKIIKE